MVVPIAAVAIAAAIKFRPAILGGWATMIVGESDLATPPKCGFRVQGLLKDLQVALPFNPLDHSSRHTRLPRSVDVPGAAVSCRDHSWLYPPVQNKATKPEPMAGCGGVKSGQ